MKAVAALSLVCLFTLSACGQAQPVPSPAPMPEISEAPASILPLPTQALTARSWDGEPSALPAQIADGAEFGGETEETVYLLAQLPEKDIALYGLCSPDKDESLLLRDGETVSAFDAPWLTPRRILPTLHLGDFDGDGTEELLALTYTGSGSGVSVWTPVLFEPNSEGWEAFTLPYEPYGGLSPLLSCQRADGESRALLSLGDSTFSLELEDYVEPQPPLEPYVGPIVSYGVEGGSITVKLGVGLYQEGVIPYTLYYVAELRGELVWDGQGFSLCSPLLGDFSD